MKSLSSYSPPSIATSVDLDLSRNEGRAPRMLDTTQPNADDLARYPLLEELRGALAERFGLPSERALVTAGADDALLRCCLATLTSGGQAVLCRPTFEMIPRYVELAGGALREVCWPDGRFPLAEFLACIDSSTSLAFVVSPNNPTGAVASAADLVAVSRALPEGLVVLDAAYGEFAEDDLTQAALELDNVVVLRTLSKAWGLAGLRVGYALGSKLWIERLAASGNPFPVSCASALGALRRLRTGSADVEDYVVNARRERTELAATFERLGVPTARPNQSNFVLARELNVSWLRAGLAALGIAVRSFPERPELEDAVRVTVPGRAAEFARLSQAIETSLAPEALLFDLDGVLADVSRSYRAAILETARSYDVELTLADVAAAKARGSANDDWRLTQQLLGERGVDVPLDSLTQRFEAYYQGTDEREGLRATERPLLDIATLAAWGTRFKLAIVTGRPRADALRFLERFELLPHFDVLVCREDAALKPDPQPVRVALAKLGVERAWMLGDTCDDLVAARSAGVLPIGVMPPGEARSVARASLTRAGAARVLDAVSELEELLP